jgi:hypothetical protein
VCEIIARTSRCSRSDDSGCVVSKPKQFLTPVLSATLTLGLFHDCPYPTAIVHIRSFEPLFVGHRRTTISHPTYTVQFYILVESLPDAPSGGFDA